MPNLYPDKSEHVFAPIGVDGSWRCSSGGYAGTLAEFLASHCVVIDDDCQFCRIIRYSGNIKFTFEYRAYNCMQVKITIYITKII